MTTNAETYYPENRRKLLIMRRMPFSCSVVSLRGTGVSNGNSEEVRRQNKHLTQTNARASFSGSAAVSYYPGSGLVPL